MRKLTLALCATLLLLSAGSALAADATGTWIGQFGGPDGGMTLTFHFKQDGSKLTGTVDAQQGGESLQIGDGKVEGNKISFTLKVDFNGDTMKITHDGTIEGDEMKLNTKMEGGPGGGGGGPLTLKRSK
jgi:hypothetical protein